MNYYSGYINELKENEVFVFGSNPEGRHGAGTAKIAKERFGAEYGVGRGVTGQCWALPTKNLKPNYFEKASGITYEVDGFKSISKEQIINNIKDLYDYAKDNSDKTFYIAYTYEGFNLNGYTGDEMFEMFTSNEIPLNIVFNDTFEIKFDGLEKDLGLN